MNKCEQKIKMINGLASTTIFASLILGSILFSCSPVYAGQAEKNFALRIGYCEHWSALANIASVEAQDWDNRSVVSTKKFQVQYGSWEARIDDWTLFSREEFAEDIEYGEHLGHLDLQRTWDRLGRDKFIPLQEFLLVLDLCYFEVSSYVMSNLNGVGSTEANQFLIGSDLIRSRR